MKNKLIHTVSLPIIILCTWVNGYAQASQNTNSQLPSIVLCGSDKVKILSLAGGKPQLLWEWQAMDDPNLNTHHFQKMDECKPVAGGKQLLVSSSTGGCALIDTTSKQALFSAYLPNAHSLELLNDEYIAAIGSSKPGGDRVVIYQLSSGHKIWEDSVFSGHGLVWHYEKSVLYALGYQDIYKYEVSLDSGFQIKLRDKISIPSTGGHDLIPGENRKELLLSTSKTVWQFDTEDHSFREFPLLKAHEKVKSLSLSNGNILLVQAEEGWWSHHLWINSHHCIHIPDIRVYKARWLNHAKVN